ncbi:MAG TPA: octanoyltransferase [Porticoccaceae bacterium]|nr:octanoyltransferase [Porticoccaceae bacterium]
MASIAVCHLGLRPYRQVFDAMRRYTAARDGEARDDIWLVQHPPVFTLGQAGRTEHLIEPGDIPVEQVDRGGQVTYHGPGQVVAYTLLDLKRQGLNVRDLVCAIETSIKQVLSTFGIPGESRDKAPGVYVAGAKIASLGLRIRKGCSYHGLALNVDLDLEPFSRINPCGYPGLAVTRMVDLLSPDQSWSHDEIEQQLVTRLADNLGYDDWYDASAEESAVLREAD